MSQGVREPSLTRREQVRRIMAQWVQRSDGSVYCGACDTTFADGLSATAHLYQRTGKIDCLDNASILASVGLERTPQGWAAHRS